MKKIFVRFAMVCALMTALCTIAFAETETGIRNVTVETAYQSSVTLTPLTSSGTAVTANSGSYPNAEKVQAVVTGTESDKQVLILTQTNEENPTESNLVYIDQKTSAASLTFTVYPKELTAGTTYYIYLVSNASTGTVQGLSKVASFEYYSEEKTSGGGDDPDPNAKLGDVDGDGTILVGDAVVILRSIAGYEDADLSGKVSIADVDGDGAVLVGDAVVILRYIAGYEDAVAILG